MTEQTKEVGLFEKAKETINDNSLKLAVGATALAATTPAFAAIDVTEAVSSIKALDDPINKIGAAIVSILVVILGWRIIKGVVR